MIKADRTVEVIVEYGRGHGDDAVFTNRMSVLGVSDNVEGYYGERTLFGLCDDFGYLTQMCYGSDHITFMEEKRHPNLGPWEGFLATTAEHGYHYFDAGGNGRPVRVRYDNLRWAFIELGLVSSED